MEVSTKITISNYFNFMGYNLQKNTRKHKNINTKNSSIELVRIYLSMKNNIIEIFQQEYEIN